MCKICKRNRDGDTEAKEGDLRVWWVPQIPTAKGVEHFSVPVKTIEEARLLLTTLGDYDWYLEAHKHRVDYSNTGGLERFEDGEWCEWYDDEGNDIDDHFAELDGEDE